MQLVQETTRRDAGSGLKGIVSDRHRTTTYEAILASDEDVRRDAFALRHASYVDGDFIAPRPDKLFRDAYDDLPNARTIVVYDDGHPVASVRVCFLSENDSRSPASDAFSSQIGTILAETRAGRTPSKAAEITRLVRSPACANNQGLVFLLYRLAGHLVLNRDVQVILSSVRDNHVAFYRRLGFERASPPASYPGLRCPMSLLRCARSSYDRVRAGFPLMDPDAVPPGTFHGFEEGRSIGMKLTFR